MKNQIFLFLDCHLSEFSLLSKLLKFEKITKSCPFLIQNKTKTYIKNLRNGSFHMNVLDIYI